MSMQQTSTALTLLDLPFEVIHQISLHLVLPELTHFASSRLRVSQITQKRLREHYRLRRRYRVVNGPGADEPLGWMGILTKVLRRQLPAEYIHELKIPNGEWYYQDLPAWTEGTQLAEEDFKIVEKAAKESPWITEHDACGPGANASNLGHFMEEIREGDQDVSRYFS